MTSSGFFQAVFFEILTIYKWLDNNFISHFMNLVKGFESAFIITCAIIFLLISVFIILRNAKKLPKSYIVEGVDLYGKKASVNGLRYTFVTYEAAESYARFYNEIFDKEYKFRVVGSKNKYATTSSAKTSYKAR
jgi:hypothetical protein